MEMIFAKKDLWEIIEGIEELPLFNAHPKVKKAYDKRANKAFSIIACNFIDKQVAHI